MIFVTVGTPEFDFTRLLKKMDEIAGETDEKVVMQTGQTDYEAENCESKSFIEEGRYQELMENARVIITHAGVGSIITCFNHGKRPIVVPRRKKYGEHQDDHQIQIAEKFSEKYGLEYIKDMDKIGGVLKKENYEFKFIKDGRIGFVKKLKNYLRDLK